MVGWTTVTQRIIGLGNGIDGTRGRVRLAAVLAGLAMAGPFTFPASAQETPADRAESPADRTETAADRAEAAHETALVPTADEFVDAPVLLPALLSLDDAERYRNIFALQEDGHWGKADRLIRGLQSKLLLGHVMAQRYLHPTRYRSRYAELRDWMAHYADHPQAQRIYKLAMKRKPRRARAPRPPIVRPAPRLEESAWEPQVFYESPKRRSSRRIREVKRTLRRVRIHAHRGWLTSARRIIASKHTRHILDNVELDIARAYLGSGYFFRGAPEKAFASADPAARRSGSYMPFAYWTAGLAAYQKGSYVDAAEHFEAMAQSKNIFGDKLAAAAFWAARSNMLARRPERVSHWLGVAAAHPRSFYGLLAGRVLGVEPRFDWSLPTLTAAHLEAVTRHPGGQRALALLQVGEDRLAELELRGLTGIDDRELGEALLAVAETARLPALSLRIAPMLSDDDGTLHHGALYPVPEWEPTGGFTVDRAVIFAFMRQESHFNTRAKSRSGARGLMQLMPATASFIGRKRYRGRRRALLYDPELNMALGQKYIRHLIDNDLIDGDMALAAAAYNGGPGNLAKWMKRADRWRYTDQLVFIETIPSRETRNYVKRVLANLWIYRHRLSQETPSLDALAAGGPPSYKALDGRKGAVEANARN